jgi:protein phosphatase
MTRLEAAGATDTGNVRDNNQDRLLLSETLYAVADGMGGHVAGEVAAEVAVDALRSAFEEDDDSGEALREAVRWANRAVWRKGQEDDDLAGMGTTLTAVALVRGTGPDGEPDETLAVANVGDSRTYLLRDGELSLLTTDHSWVQEMVRTGQLRAEDAGRHPKRSTLTRAVGIGPEVLVDVSDVIPYAGDRLLLCSDGLWDELGDDLIAEILRSHAHPQDAADELVDEAKSAGGRDNITVIVVDVVDDGGRAEEASAALVDEPTRVVSVRDVGAGANAVDRAEPVTAASAQPTASPTGVLRNMAPAVSRPAEATVPGRADPAAPVVLRSATVAGAHPRRFTWRVAFFLAALAAVVVAGFGAVAYYGSHSYYVGINADNVVAIYKGRPGGFLWMGSTQVEATPLQRAQVPPASLHDLANGKAFSSRSAARAYVTSLGIEAAKQGRLGANGGSIGTLAPGATIPPGNTASTAASSTTLPPVPGG